MKKLVVLVVAILLPVSVFAQDYKKFESNVQVGTGFSWTDDDSNRLGGTLSLGYGLDIRVDELFSIMPMVEYRLTSESAIRSGWDGADFNDFSFLDLSLSARWHFNSGKTPVVFGIAPYISYALDRDSYYVDYDPNDSLNGLTKLKKVSFGLMPTVSFDVLNHFSIGAKANIGVTDASVKYSFIQNQEPRFLKSAEIFLRARF